MDARREALKVEFEALAKPMIKFLNDNFCPHCHIYIDPTTAELSEGDMAFYTEEFLND